MEWKFSRKFDFPEVNSGNPSRATGALTSITITSHNAGSAALLTITFLGMAGSINFMLLLPHLPLHLANEQINACS